MRWGLHPLIYNELFSSLVDVRSPTCFSFFVGTSLSNLKGRDDKEPNYDDKLIQSYQDRVDKEWNVKALLGASSAWKNRTL